MFNNILSDNSDLKPKKTQHKKTIYLNFKLIKPQGRKTYAKGLQFDVKILIWILILVQNEEILLSLQCTFKD